MSIDAGDARTKPRALGQKLFSSKLEELPDGGLIVHDVPLLAVGTWTDSNVQTPLHYTAAELEKSASNWAESYMWNRHMGGAPRSVDEIIGYVQGQHWDSSAQAVVGDVYYDGISSQSTSTIKRIKAAAEGKAKPLWVSVEHFSDDVYNSTTKQYEATNIEYIGIATVTMGACKRCRLNEKSRSKTDSSKGMDLEIKELETKVTELTKELEGVKAAKTVPVTDFEAVQKTNKEMSELLKKSDETIKALEARVKKLEDAPAPVKTGAATAEVELVMI